MKKYSVLLGATFLMATSAIGPGFLNNTCVFTNKLGASFGFVILFSIVLDLIAQLNIWRIIALSEMKAQDLANNVLPGLGYLLSFLIVSGGLAFNIGNIAGAGLGIQVLTGLDIRIGAVISVGIAIFIFMSKSAGQAMDIFTKILGTVMLVLILYVVFRSQPPLEKALYYSLWPSHIDIKSIITLVGGTVGGYISFAGGHRLLEAGIKGKSALKDVTKSATQGILLTSLIRIILFLAAFGVLTSGFTLDATNPAASVFRSAAGTIGYIIFGIVLWCAALTSIVGSAYTSVSFVRSFHPALEKNSSIITAGFIIISAIIFIFMGQSPAHILVVVGYLNGLILPLALLVMLVAVRKLILFQSYRYSVVLQISGWLVVCLLLWMSISDL